MGRRWADRAAEAQGRPRVPRLGPRAGRKDEGTNPGRTANKTCEHLRAVLSWAWEQELIEAPPRFPGPRVQRDVAGRRYLTKAEINVSTSLRTPWVGRKAVTHPCRSVGTGVPPFVFFK